MSFLPQDGPPRVTGLDLSLTSSGVAHVVAGQPPNTLSHGTSGHNDATLEDRYARLHILFTQLEAEVLAFHPDLVVVESPSYSSATGHSHDRSGLWWLVVAHLLALAIPVLEVRPNLRAKYATGKGGAGKQEVVIAVTRRYPTVEFATNDEADALVLAAMGSRLLGHPIEDSLPETHRDSLKTLRLPTMPKRISLPEPV